MLSRRMNAGLSNIFKVVNQSKDLNTYHHFDNLSERQVSEIADAVCPEGSAKGVREVQEQAKAAEMSE